ncbi:zinc finger protein 260 [Aedes albopictus]|uniref:C2h2-type zn-finger protein n=1 Tax=Aedes albopictus TaxID=7160 RepID=A0ABM1ZYX4_AEDAL
METFSLLSCRMCLRIPSDGALTFSVSDTFKGHRLSDLIGQLFGIKVSEADFLTNVCVECMDRINTVRTINQQFSQNNEKLKQLLEAFKEDSEDVEVLVIDDINLLNEQEAHMQDDIEVEERPMKSEPEPSPVSSHVDEEEEEDNVVEHKSEIGIEFIKNQPVDLEYEEPLEDNLLVDVVDSSSTENAVLASDICSPVDNVQNELPVKPKPVSKKVRPVYQIPNHKCYFCKTTFQTELDFTEHLHVHFGEVPLVCDKCDNIVIKSVRQASKHLALHDEEERPHKCRICELRFFTRENSLTHERKIHRMKVKIKENIDGYADRQKLRKTFRCKICGQTAANRQYLKEHEVTHEPPVLPIHTCQVCGKQFTARKNLTRHLMIHTGELPYKCEFCDRAFRQAGDLKDHIRSHTKEKPYMCNSCGMRFRNVSMLHVHRKKQQCSGSDE